MWWRSFFILKILSFTYYDIVQAVAVDIRRGEAVAKVRPNLAAGQIVQVRQVRIVENNLNKNNSISLSAVHNEGWGKMAWSGYGLILDNLILARKKIHMR